MCWKLFSYNLLSELDSTKLKKVFVSQKLYFNLWKTEFAQIFVHSGVITLEDKDTFEHVSEVGI